MPENIITYSFGENFIEKLASFIEAEFSGKDMDLSRIAIVFGGKRPELFLKRRLAQKINKTFYPPRFFSIDEFVEYLVSKKNFVKMIGSLDACYRIYGLAQKQTPRILEARESFPLFLGWSREILSFIDQMDLEGIEDSDLKNIQDNARIGYDVPKSINELLSSIVLIRSRYHEQLKQENMFSPGTLSLYAANNIKDIDTGEFDQILFCNFFDLQNSRKKIIKHFLDNDKAKVFFQTGEGYHWKELEKLEKYFECRIKPENEVNPVYNLNLYSGFDMHSQVGIARELIKKIDSLDKTVIVLPDTGAVVPLLSEISNYAGDFNVSLGYPIEISSVYVLFSYIINAQNSKKNSSYYALDYLKVLRHPFIKNLKIKHDAELTRILTHKLEDMLTGAQDSPLGGSLFIDLRDVEKLKPLYELVIEQSRNSDYEVTEVDIREILEKIHWYSFKIWEDIKTFSVFAERLNDFTSMLIDKSFLAVYALNLKAAERVCAISDELAQMSFSQTEFLARDILKIFEDKLRAEKVSFTGVPLKGLQILGLFETRSLDFENVIILDVNESVLPKLKIHEPLIPRQVMINLGFDQLEVEDAIQRYHFTRLISSAKNVYLIYDDSPEKQRSRFIEELIWTRQLESRDLNVLPVTRASFNLNVHAENKAIEKTKEVLKFLKSFVYSPSSINTYLNCPLQFYYKTVLALKEAEDLLEEPEMKNVGNFIHKLLEDTYRVFINAKPEISDKFKTLFLKEFEKRFDDEFFPRMKSDSFMLKYIIKYRLERFLENELLRVCQIRKILGLEQELVDRIELPDKKVSFKCRIDRIEELEDSSILVIDYKTGSIDSLPKSISKLSEMEMDRKSIQKNVQSFQLPIYTYVVQKRYPEALINSCLYSLKSSELGFFPKQKELESLDKVMELCLSALNFIIDEINNPDIGFAGSFDNARTCQYCEFKQMCG